MEQKGGSLIMEPTEAYNLISELPKQVYRNLEEARQDKKDKLKQIKSFQKLPKPKITKVRHDIQGQYFRPDEIPIGFEVYNPKNNKNTKGKQGTQKNFKNKNEKSISSKNQSGKGKPKSNKTQTGKRKFNRTAIKTKKHSILKF